MEISKWLRSRMLGYLQLYFRSFVQAAQHEDHLEVERKFGITDREAQELPGRLMSKGFAPYDAVEMKDYFLPPEAPGEMLRVRQEKSRHNPPVCILTLKSWQTTRDGGKERSERERETRAAVGWLWIILGRLIKGSSLLSFSKHREVYHGTVDDRQTVASIDHVSGLGIYSGYYLEIEVIMPAGSAVNAVRDQIYELAGSLLNDPRDVKRSYLDMLVESQSSV